MTKQLVVQDNSIIRMVEPRSSETYFTMKTSRRRSLNWWNDVERRKSWTNFTTITSVAKLELMKYCEACPKIKFPLRTERSFGLREERVLVWGFPLFAGLLVSDCSLFLYLGCGKLCGKLFLFSTKFLLTWPTYKYIISNVPPLWEGQEPWKQHSVEIESKRRLSSSQRLVRKQSAKIGKELEIVPCTIPKQNTKTIISRMRKRTQKRFWAKSSNKI